MCSSTPYEMLVSLPFSLSSSSLGAPRERWTNLQSSQICVVYLAKLSWLTSESLQIYINKPKSGSYMDWKTNKTKWYLAVIHNSKPQGKSIEKELNGKKK